MADIQTAKLSLTKKNIKNFFPNETYNFAKINIPKETKILSTKSTTFKLYTGLNTIPFTPYYLMDDDLYYKLLKENIYFIAFFSAEQAQIGCGVNIPILSVKEIVHCDKNRYLLFYSNLKEVTKVYKVITENKENYLKGYEKMKEGFKALDSGDITKAENKFIEALSIQPFITKARNTLANIYILKNQIHMAEKELLISSKMNPNYPQTYALLGQVYFLEGDKTKAKNFWEKALILANKRYDLKLAKKIEEDLLKLK